jgi:hypothetical protein
MKSRENRTFHLYFTMPYRICLQNCGGSRPEAVVQALQVLEVREQLERGSGVHESCSGGLESLGATGPDLDMAAADLDAGEKALVREMCNVRP